MAYTIVEKAIQFQHLDRAQKLISSSVSRHLSTRNISSKSMHAFLSNLANRQTDRQTNTGKNIYLFLCRRQLESLRPYAMWAHQPRRYRCVYCRLMSRCYWVLRTELTENSYHIHLRTRPAFFGPKLHACQVSYLHLLRLQCYRADEMLLTQRNKQTKHADRHVENSISFLLLLLPSYYSTSIYWRLRAGSRRVT